jgi:uncharacterized protein with NRDE domain
MCVIYFALNKHSDHPLILLANRDEFYARPSRAAGYWDDFPHIYGGRDLHGGGTWLGVTDTGRFAAVTNYRDPSAPHGPHSRGELVAEFLKRDQTARQYLENIHSRAKDYAGFNLLVGELTQDRAKVHYFSNRGDDPRQLPPGIYGLSNHLLDTPWPKVVKGKSRFEELLRLGEPSNESFFDVLSDASLAADEDLPSTGIPYEAEKAISAIFIKTPDYGTRTSTVLRFCRTEKWRFEEQVFA